MVRFWVGKSEDNFSVGDDDLGYRLYTIIVRFEANQLVNSYLLIKEEKIKGEHRGVTIE